MIFPETGKFTAETHLRQGYVGPATEGAEKKI
jgi:hypothetical protein